MGYAPRAFDDKFMDNTRPNHALLYLLDYC